MDVREAVKQAKQYVANLFQEEGVQNLGLEEVEHDDSAGAWDVTVGFSRPWTNESPMRTALQIPSPLKRAYKVVRIRDEDGKILSVKIRDVAQQ